MAPLDAIEVSLWPALMRVRWMCVRISLWDEAPNNRLRCGNAIDCGCQAKMLDD